MMLSASDTAYPRLKAGPSDKELAEVYTPTESELACARKRTNQPAQRLGLLSLLCLNLTGGGRTLGQATLFDESVPGVPIVDPLPNNLSLPASRSSAVTAYQPLGDAGGTAAVYRIHTTLAAVSAARRRR